MDIAREGLGMYREREGSQDGQSEGGVRGMDGAREGSEGWTEREVRRMDRAMEGSGTYREREGSGGWTE